ncbi:glutamine amidotransferase [Aliiroseovarius zhejiangensis]|uniref:Glutamine amidotransferase n=1 Tax=Aliiroseovarius zhejiangensis TaxID=1632025 RepID=A0ABQ3IIH5_9RHOB|nr:glutamine amidotransferase [Aliiroseovarius zhejiangensis]GHE85504.1 glutamine amidotransferase [Aliiroseovarius zhejiangensis]
MKPFLILQLRPETDASDDEFRAFLAKGGLEPDQVHRIRLDQQDIPASLRLGDYSGVIVGGGPGCVSDAPGQKSAVEARIEAQCLSLMPQITGQDIPFLGCCYGIGILGHHLAPGSVTKDQYGEPVSASPCEVTTEGRNDPLLDGIPDRFEAFVGHKEAMQHLPHGCHHLVASPRCPFQMIRHGQNVYATQFHPEADAHSFETRIGIYKHHGYFPPEEAEALVDMVHAANVHAPAQILRNFVTRYRA